MTLDSILKTLVEYEPMAEQVVSYVSLASVCIPAGYIGIRLCASLVNEMWNYDKIRAKKQANQNPAKDLIKGAAYNK